MSQTTDLAGEAGRYAAINAQIGRILQLPASGSWPEVPHKLDEPSAYAIIAAAAAGRPLLVRGEPGVGKSQLARAAAQLLERQFLAFVIQPDSEYQELLWALDHTVRLADAQLQQADKVRQVKNYVGPGALWWALDWRSAQDQARLCNHNFNPPEGLDPSWPEQQGCVLLIDEIDKADIALANGLLEVLGNRQFAVPPLGIEVPSKKKPPQHPAPLVVLTSNDTRQLPAALLRRCVVLRMTLPEDLQGHFIDRGETHFPDLDPRVLAEAAEQILKDREACAATARTGLAEYLDLLKALTEVATDPEDQLAWLDRLSVHFKKSHAG